MSRVSWNIAFKKDIKDSQELGNLFNKSYMNFTVSLLLFNSSTYATFFQDVAINQPFQCFFFVLNFFSGEIFLIEEYISYVNMRLKLKLSSPVQGTHQGSVGGHQVHLLVQHWKKKFRSHWIVIKLNGTVMTVVSLLLSVRISFIAILRLIFIVILISLCRDVY